MTTSPPDSDGVPPALGEVSGRPAAVILAASQKVVSAYGEDQLVCLTDVGGRSVIEWWAWFLAAWAITDRTIVASQAHRSCFVPPPSDEEEVYDDRDSEDRFDVAVARAVARRRELTDQLHVPASVAAGLPNLGRYVFLGRDIPADPLAQLLDVLPRIDNDLVLVIDGDTLPPPINPYEILPTVLDAACIALGPAGPVRHRGYAIDWMSAAGQVPVTNVIDPASPAPPRGLLGESLGVTGVRRASVLAAAENPDRARRWAELHATWAKAGVLCGRYYNVPSPRLTTPVHRAAARAEFHLWRTALATLLGEATVAGPFNPGQT